MGLLRDCRYSVFRGRVAFCSPRSILTEKFWVLRLGATAIYVGRADSYSTQSACDVVS